MIKIRNYLKIIGYLIVGGLISHFIVTPYLQGYFNTEVHSINSFFTGSENDDINNEEKKFEKIERNIQKQIFNEFHKEFGSDAIIKYEKYVSQVYRDSSDVFLFNYSRHELNNRSRQLNPNNNAYWRSRGYSETPANSIDGIYEYSKDELDNHSDQLNPNNDSYWQSRGYNEKPID